MVRYRRNRVPNGTYFFTVTLRNRQSDALVRNVDALREAWRSARSRTPHEAIAVVVLPDHLHAVIRMRDGGDYSRLWQDIKKGFTRRTTTTAPSPWQPRFWEHTIRDEDDLRRHVDYVHIR
jgi:putative transposase